MGYAIMGTPGNQVAISENYLLFAFARRSESYGGHNRDVASYLHVIGFQFSVASKKEQNNNYKNFKNITNSSQFPI